MKRLGLFVLFVVIAGLPYWQAARWRNDARDAHFAAGLVARRQSTVTHETADLRTRFSQTASRMPRLTAAAAAASSDDLYQLYLAANDPATRAFIDGHILADRDPKFAQTASDAFRSLLRLRYGPLFAELKFNDEQKAAFENLLTKGHDEAMDIAATAAHDNLAADDPAIASLQQQAVARQDAVLRKLLGPGSYAQYLDYERQIPAQPLVVGILQANATGPGAMTPMQAAQLMSILSDASPQYAAGGKLAVSDLDWDQVLARAPGVLTPSEFEVLQADATSSRANHLLSQSRTQPASIR